MNFKTPVKTTLRYQWVIILLITSGSLFAQNHTPRTIHQQSDETIVLKAATGKASGTEIAYMPEWEAFGWFRSDGKVEWEAVVAHRGTYQVFLEWSVSDEEAGKEFSFSTGKKKITGTVGKSGSWETFKKEYIGDLKLKKGNHRFVFEPSKPFPSGALLDLKTIELVPLKH